MRSEVTPQNTLKNSLRRGIFSRLLLIGGLFFIVYAFLGNFQVDASLRYRLAEPLGVDERLELEYLGSDGELLARAVFYAREGSGREIIHELKLPKGHHRVELSLHRGGEITRASHSFKMPLEGIEIVRVDPK